MSRCFPFPPPGYVKIGERGGKGPIEIESIKLQKEIKKTEKERKREKKREKKELLKKQQQGVSDGKNDKLDGKIGKLDSKKPLQGDVKKTDGKKPLQEDVKKPLQGDAKKTDAILSDNSSRSGISEEHGQAIPENTFYLSDDTDSSKKRKREEQSVPTVERKGTKLKLSFSLKKPSASAETTICRDEPTCSTSNLQNPSVAERQEPSQQKCRPIQSLASREPKGRDAKPIANRSQVRPLSGQKTSISAEKSLGSRQSTLSASVVFPELKKASASELVQKKASTSKVAQHNVSGEPTSSLSGVVRSHPGMKTSLAAPPVLVGSRDVVLDIGGLKLAQVRGGDQPSTSATQQETLALKRKSDRKDKSEKKERKRRRQDLATEAMYNSLTMNWVPPMVVSDASTDDQEWLFGSKLESRAVHHRSDAAANFVLPGCEWPPKAHYLAEGGIHALPFTVPF